jgi:integrase
VTENPLASMPFSSASAFWFEQHSRYIKPNTAKTYAGALKALRPFFGETLLRDITIDHLRQYQDERRKKAGATLLNSELGVVQMILRGARLWKNLEDDYKPLPVSRCGAGRSLSKEEEDRLRAVAFSKPKWRVAAHSMAIMLNTTMGFGELRQLRRKDVDMERGCVTIREGAKNLYRQRTIPLNASARESMQYILKRWAEIGGSSPEHYILPHRPRGQRASHWRKKIPWILDEPTTAMYSAFRSIRNAAGLPHMRVYDCRVQAITKLLSHPEVSAQVSKEIAGHISQAMQNRYSKQQFDTKKAALDALDNAPPTIPGEPDPPTKPPAMQAEIDRLQAEIVRLTDRQSDSATREHPLATRSPETYVRPRSKSKSPRAGSSGVVPKCKQLAKNLIVFPSRSA